MQHVGQKHRGQTLLALAQSPGLSALWHNQIAALSPVQLLRVRHSSPRLGVGDTFQDRRQPGHQDAAAGGTAGGQQLPQSPQPVPPGEPLDGSPLPNCPVRDVVLTERDKQLLTERRRASAMALPRCVVSRYATAWAESQ